MMWVVIFHLACLALTLEFIYRAPDYDEHAGVFRYARRSRAEPMMSEESFEAGSGAP
jgi:hypothetical protein